MLQRFQLIVWPELAKNWQDVDRRPNATYRDQAFKLYQILDQLTPEDVGAVYPEFGDLAYLRFDDDGQEVFTAWRADLEARIRSADMERSPSFESHLAKYRSLMPSLALIFHLLDCAAYGRSGPVSYAAAVMAVEWCKFLEAHARKVYAPELNLDAQAAHALVKKIQEEAVTDGDAVRDIYRNQWAKLTTAEDVRSGLRMLQKHHWLHVVKEGKGSNKAEAIRLHPKLVKA